jgi:hypothetical protein
MLKKILIAATLALAAPAAVLAQAAISMQAVSATKGWVALPPGAMVVGGKLTGNTLKDATVQLPDGKTLNGVEIRNVSMGTGGSVVGGTVTEKLLPEAMRNAWTATTTTAAATTATVAAPTIAVAALPATLTTFGAGVTVLGMGAAGLAVAAVGAAVTIGAAASSSTGHTVN